MSGETGVRKAEDIGGQELSYAEVKAIASGNPAVLTLAEADAELQRLSVLRKNHTDEQYTARLRVKQLPDTIERLDAEQAMLSADKATAEEHAKDPVVIGNRSCRKDTVLDELASALESLPERVIEPSTHPIGTFRGLDFGVKLHPQFPPEVYLAGQSLRRTNLTRDHQGPRAVLNALERLAEGYEERIAKTENERALCQDQLRDYGARLGVPFEQEAYFARLTDLRDRLKAALSKPGAASEEPDTPSAADIAGAIIALKQSQGGGKAAERTGGGRRGDAAEPITLQVRRRATVAEAETSPGDHAQAVRDRLPSGWKR
jgi:hypothetical protein